MNAYINETILKLVKWNIKNNTDFGFFEEVTFLAISNTLQLFLWQIIIRTAAKTHYGVDFNDISKINLRGKLS